MPPALPSRHPTTIHPSTHFLESAGCILFDFRNTPLQAKVTSLINRTERTSSSISTSTSASSQIPIIPNPESTTSEPLIHLLHHTSTANTHLPKGRLNTSEHRSLAALRETHEETGLHCSLLPCILLSRATSTNPTDDRTNSNGYTLDEVRTFHGSIDPFMVMLRRTRGPGVLGDGESEVEVMKMIWWFIAVVVDGDNKGGQVELDPGYEVMGVPMGEAADRCSFEDDAGVVREAIFVVRRTLGI